MQPPRLLEKQAELPFDRLVAAQEMVESRYVRALGMAPLRRLVELLRSAEENKACPRRGARKYIGETHLGGFMPSSLGVSTRRRMSVRPDHLPLLSVP